MSAPNMVDFGMAEIVPFPAPRPVECEIQYVSLEEMFSVLTRRKTLAQIGAERIHAAVLDHLRQFDVPKLRHFWDNVSDIDSYYDGPEGSFDWFDIHRVLNEKGDGYYCAV